MNTLRKNAFVVGTQASGDSFFGRAEEIADLESSIFRGVEAVHLVGPTRIGKSSLVSYVFEKNRKMPERLCVKMTMGECLNAYDFWKTLIDELRGSIYDAGLWNCEFERYYGLIHDTVDPQDEDWFIYFKGPLKSILKTIQKYSYRLVLAIDEFDSVDRIFDQKTHYFQVLRSIYSEPEYVTSGVIISRKRLQLFEEKCKDISTFHGVFREKTLRAFSNEDMVSFYQAMENHGFRLSAEGKDKFEYFTGRMPYFCCMFADRMAAHGWTGDFHGSNEVVQIFEECIPQINRHYNDLIERLESDNHTETVYYLSIGLMLPTITKRHIQNLIAMGVLVSEIEDGSTVYYAFSRDFMTYFSTKPLDLPAWETLTLSERKIKEIFKREYPVLESLTYERLKETDAREVIREINEEYPELCLNWRQIQGYCENLSAHKANPTVLDVLTLSKIVGIMLNTWDSRFFKYFTGESEWKFKLEQIKRIRNPMAHAHIEYVREDVLATCMKYCDELIHMEIG